MKQLSHFETSDRERKLVTIIGRLLATIDSLTIDIANEEEGTGVKDVANPAYSSNALALRVRRDNLTATVDLLRKRMLPAESTDLFGSFV